VSQPQPAPGASFADLLAEATARLDAAIDATMQTVSGSSPLEATDLAHRVLGQLRSAKEAFDGNFDASIERLERVAAGSHEPVPKDGAGQ
jgi:hypothetical protein